MGDNNSDNPQMPYTIYWAAVLLLLRQGESYGYALLEDLAELGLVPRQSGTLYRNLRQMEKEGLLKSAWDTSNNGAPPRRVYTITAAGTQDLVAFMEVLRQQKVVITKVQRRYGALQPPIQSTS